MYIYKHLGHQRKILVLFIILMLIKNVQNDY